MSFSIPTLRGFMNKIGGTATLNAPVISTISSTGCGYGGCGTSVAVTITADVGNRVAFRTTSYSDSSTTVSCSDYEAITTGNIAYLDGQTLLGDHYSCRERMPNGVKILAVACNGSNFSNVSTASFSGIACPTSIPAPTINIVSNTGGIVTYSVTSNYCNTTYINNSSGTFCQPPETLTNINGTYSFTGSGTTSSIYSITGCSPGVTVYIQAVTYFDQNPLCTTRISSVASSGVTVN